MIRAVEIGLFLAPFAALILWRLLLPDAPVSRGVVIATVAAVFLTGVVLLWVRVKDAEPAATAYIPAHLEDGRITPPDAEPR